MIEVGDWVLRKDFEDIKEPVPKFGWHRGSFGQVVHVDAGTIVLNLYCSCMSTNGCVEKRWFPEEYDKLSPENLKELIKKHNEECQKRWLGFKKKHYKTN